MRKLLLIPLIVSLFHCSSPSLPAFKSLVEEQPWVIRVEPVSDSHLIDPVSIHLEFSQRIDLQQLDDLAIVLLQGPIEKEILENPDSLVEELELQNLQAIPTQVILDGEERGLTVQPTQALMDGVYHLVVTPRLLSINGVPFNQTPGEKTTSFISTYYYGEVSATTIPSISSEEGELSFGPEPESLVLNEILYDGKVSDTDGESFVELYGSPGADISLYRISLINGSDGEEIERVTLPAGSILPSDGIFVIADLRTNSKTTSQVANFDYLDHFDPQNGPDSVQLFSRSEKLLDSLSYGEGAVQSSKAGFLLHEGAPAPDVTAGHSLSRVDGADTNDNFFDFVDLTAPTPGIL